MSWCNGRCQPFKTEIFTSSTLTSQCLSAYLSTCALTYFLTSHLFCFHLFIHLFSLHAPPSLPPRCDITAVLLYVEQLLLSLCESPEALVRSNPSSAIAIIAGVSDWPYQIHSLCEQLLTVLVIVTAPLSLLYRFVFTVLLFYLQFSKIYDPIIPKYLNFNNCSFQPWN